MSIQSQRIKTRRIEIGLSQEELAHLIGTSQSQVSRYERDGNDATGEVLGKLALALNTTTDYLLGITNIPDKPLRGTGDLDPIEVEIFNLLRQQSDETRLRALGIIRALVLPEPTS